VVRRKGFLLFELMVFIIVVSSFGGSFYLFETKILKTTDRIVKEQKKIDLLKQDYYLAMTVGMFDVMASPRLVTEVMDETHYKVKVVSDNVFSSLFVIRKK